MEEFIIFFLGVIAGAIGYLIATFWMRPILRYLDVKHAVTADLVFYANAIMVAEDAVVVPEMKQARTQANRKNAAELVACSLRLPTFYNWMLRKRGEDPLAASSELIGLANASIRDHADRHIELIKKHLKIPKT